MRHYLLNLALPPACVRVQVRSGGPELALELEKDGYAFLDMDEKAFKDAE